MLPRQRKGRYNIKPLSFTKINLYRTCPLQYKLQYIDGLKPKFKWYFSFGSTLHTCAEHFFKVNVPPPPTLDELLGYYEDNWRGAGYPSPEEEARHKEYGREILIRFWELHYEGFQMPLAIEKLFNIDVDGIKLRGYIDRVDKLASGGLSIIDYKSNREFFTNDYLENDLQLTLYQLAAEQLWQLPVERLALYHLRSNTPCNCAPRDSAQLEGARQLMRDVAEGITAEIFPARENQYCPCDFPQYCPYYRHLYIGEKILPSKDDTPGRLEITDAVAQYASLQQQIKSLQSDLGKLKEDIVAFCEAKELNRIYGDEHTLTYKLVARTGFSEEEVRALLAPEGLWERVLSMDASLVKELIAGDEASAEIRQQLTALQQVISRYPQLWLGKNEEKDKER